MSEGKKKVGGKGKSGKMEKRTGDCDLASNEKKIGIVYERKELKAGD